MFRKFVCYICLLLVVNATQGQANNSILHFQYRIVETDNINIDTIINFPIKTRVNTIFDIYTNKREYLIIPVIEEASFNNKTAPQIVEEGGAILVNVFTDKVFFIEDETYSSYEPLALSKLNKNDTLFYYTKNNDTIKFIVDKKYGKEVTPFPYYLFNNYGVKEIFSKNFKCDLLIVEMINDDKLLQALTKTRSFTQKTGFFRFPW